jgi:hypothetical protein
MKTTTLIFLFSCIFLYSYGQFSNYSFDEVSMDELLMNDCPFEPGAPAMVIAKKCELVCNLVEPYSSRKMNRRTKIFTKEGLSQGSYEIEYNHDISEITSIIASVYNIENESITKITLKPDDYYYTRTDRNYSKCTFTLPNVKEGSVIDIYYTQTLKVSRQFEPWYFQDELPVGWSEFVTLTRKKTNYNYYYSDVLPFVTNTIESPPDEEEIKGGYVVNRFAVENAPSVHVSEPFILRPQDQISKVEIVYHSFNTKSLWGNYESAMSWTTIGLDLANNPYMGNLLFKGGFLQKQVNAALINCTSFDDSLKAVYEFVRQNMKSNGYINIYASNLKKTWKRKSGNIGEINLLLLAALYDAGFDCHPLLLATSEDAPPSKTDPRRNGINYLVAAVFRDTTYYLLDASNRYIACNSLTMRCLNGEGFLVSYHTHDKWLPLLRNETIKTQTNLSYAWNPGKADTVFVERSSYSLSANRFRYIISEQGEDEYIKTRKLDFQDKNISTPTYSGLTETEKPFVEKFNFVMKPKDYNSTDSYFLQTIPFEPLKENPFDAIKRDFRIDFQVPYNESINLAVKIPEGFSITFIPENISIRDLGGDLVFDFTVMLSPDKKEIWVHSGMQVNRISFSRDEYSDIRQFFAEIVKAQNTLIELKKD